jgi:hypothetical protein
MTITEAKSWFQQHQAIAVFLGVQGIGGIVAIATLIAYMTQLESRMTIIEVRGSPHLGIIDNRLTVLESQTKSNADRIDRLVDKATK